MTKSDLNTKMRTGLKKATSLMSRGKLAEAGLILDSLERICPSHPAVKYQQEKLLSGMGKRKVAGAKQARDFSGMLSLAHSMRQQEKFCEAIEACEELLKIDENVAEVFWEKGCAEQANGDYESAILSFSSLLKLDDSSASAFNNLGACLQQVKRLDESELMYRNALKLRPDYFEAKKNLGNLYIEAGSYHQAAVELRPFGDARSRAQLLECQYRLGRFSDYQTAAEELASIQPDNIRAAAITSFISQQISKENPFRFCPDPLDFIRVGEIETYVKDVEIFVGRSLSFLEEVDSKWEPMNKTTKSGYQSEGNLFDLYPAQMQEVRHICESELIRYREEYISRNCGLISHWPEKFDFNAWFVRLGKGGCQESHIHPSGWVSGVIYLQTVLNPEANEGAIQFSTHGFDLPIINQLPQSLTLQPERGQIILFPSSLFHKTVPLRQDVERSVIAFDLRPL